MIAIVVDSLERYSFFSRIIKSINGKHQILLITSEPYAYFASKKLKCISYLIYRKCNGPHVDTIKNGDYTDVMKSIEVLNNDISIEMAKRDYECSLNTFIHLFEQFKVNKCLIWNGQQLLGRAATKACKLLDVETSYIEIANLPEKLFVDPLGVNALSSIAHDLSIIDSLPEVDDYEHKTWLQYYEACKQKPLPQAQSSYKKLFKSTINYIFKLLFPAILKKKPHKLKIKKSIPIKLGSNKDSSLFLNSDYLFLPLQVSGDTQIKLHSKYDNIDAIKYAIEDAKKNSLKLVIKIHPAENDKSEVNRILDLQKENDFLISDVVTTTLIKNARKIITINSTVGLEGLMYEKDVEAIGNCFYKDFDQARLKKYIHCYLLDGVDYFSNDLMPLELSERIISK